MAIFNSYVSLPEGMENNKNTRGYGPESKPLESPSKDSIHSKIAGKVTVCSLDWFTGKI